MYVFVRASMFVNVNRGLNDDKQMSAVDASTQNMASLPPEITAKQRLATLQAHTWLHCGSVGREEEK